MKSYILIGILAFIFGYSFGLLAYLVANDKVHKAVSGHNLIEQQPINMVDR